MGSSNDCYASEGIPPPHIMDPNVLSDFPTKTLLTVLTTNISTLQHSAKSRGPVHRTQLFVHVKISNDALVYFTKVLQNFKTTPFCELITSANATASILI